MTKMNSDILETFVLCSGVLWESYKFVKTKELKHLFLICSLLLFLLWRWPLYLSGDLAFGLMGFMGAGFLTYENYGRGKKSQPLAYLYIILFFALGSMLIAHAFA